MPVTYGVNAVYYGLLRSSVVSAQSKVKETKVKRIICAPIVRNTDSKESDISISPDDHKSKEDKVGSVQPYSFSEFWEFYDKKRTSREQKRCIKDF